MVITRIGLQYAEVQESNCAPAHYKRFLLELAKNTPICALLQFGWDSSVRGLLCGIAAARWDITDSRKRKECAQEFISCHCGHDLGNKEGRKHFVSQEFRDVLADRAGGYHIRQGFERQFRIGNSEYPGADTVTTQLSYFPQCPVVRGIANYKVPKRTTKDLADLCLKHKRRDTLCFLRASGHSHALLQTLGLLRVLSWRVMKACRCLSR